MQPRPSLAASVLWLLSALQPLLLSTRAQVSDGRAQGPSIPLVIAVAENFPYRNADAVLVRRVSASDHDVVLIKRGRVDARLLADAAGMVQTVRRHFGQVPTSDMLIRVPERPPQAKRLADAVAWSEMLRRVSPRDLPALSGFGKVAYIRVFLPSR